MPVIELLVESGDTVCVRYERGESVHLVVNGSETELAPDDMSRLFAALVVARRSAWGYS